ncbi:lysostaphin resistance A-like protein [Dactylosporangium sp. CA-092794]|uniref:CPBP family intramembrane glutamic endopeptidase n=1 Tax=Dactylosporangium sp. CA-092794 TaxID=3239929 RepID=UPI003D8D1E7C
MKTALRYAALVAALIATRFAVSAPLDAIGAPGLVSGLLTAAAVLGVYVWLSRKLIGRRPEELIGGYQQLGQGLLIGFALFTGTLALIAMFGMWRIDGAGSFTGMLSALGLAAMAAVIEELVIRGILFRTLEQKLGTWWALGVSALVFGLLHLVNPGATVVGVLAIGVEAGVMLALAYVVTRKLWLGIGIHLAWNFTEAGIFGTPVSSETVNGWMRSHLVGPSVFTGGAFGVEASLITVLTCLTVAGLLYRRARRDGRIIARPGRGAGAPAAA